MTKKELERKLIELENKLVEFDRELDLMRFDQNLNKKLTVDQAKKRDYIVRTDYFGKIKDKKIKGDFKKEIEDEIGCCFESITTQILNYDFYFENKNALTIFNDILKKYEYKQLIMNTYGDKNEK